MEILSDDKLPISEDIDIKRGVWLPFEDVNIFSQAKLPNILMIITHDTGQYFGCYQAPIETPNIDKLASNGVRFANHFCTAPQCSPSRGSILTGMIPHSHGLMGLVNYGWNLPETIKTLPRILQEHGYETHLIGLQHEQKDAVKLGYQHISPRNDFPYIARSIVPKVGEFLDKVEKQEIRMPFYCNVGFFETHRPFTYLDDDLITASNQVVIPPYLPDHPDVRDDIGEFEASVKTVDSSISEIMYTLKKTSFYRNTIIIFTVDHGWPFPRAKCTLYDAGIKTALIMAWPGKVEGGKVYSELVSNIDLLPTLLDLIGIEENNNTQGVSFFPLLFDAEFTERESVFFELTHHDWGYNPMRGIRTKRWKYIKNFGPLKSLFEIPDDIEMGDSYEPFIQHYPRYDTPRPPEELYDLEQDPHEFTNLAADLKYAAIRKKLHDQLMSWLEKTNDPILKGEVPAPEKPKFFYY